MADSKVCAICGTPKPLDEFSKNNHRSDGHGSYCKPCAREKYHIPARLRKLATIEQHFHGVQDCRVCRRSLSVTDFYWKRDQGRYASECKACKSERDKSRRDPEAIRARNLQKYGLTVTQYDRLLRDQRDVCAICGGVDDIRLAVDHNHRTGQVRGLLCGNCNRGLGHFADDPERLRSAIDYLARATSATSHFEAVNEWQAPVDAK